MIRHDTSHQTQSPQGRCQSNEGNGCCCWRVPTWSLSSSLSFVVRSLFVDVWLMCGWCVVDVWLMCGWCDGSICRCMRHDGVCHSTGWNSLVRFWSWILFSPCCCPLGISAPSRRFEYHWVDMTVSFLQDTRDHQEYTLGPGVLHNSCHSRSNNEPIQLVSPQLVHLNSTLSLESLSSTVGRTPHESRVVLSV